MCCNGHDNSNGSDRNIIGGNDDVVSIRSIGTIIRTCVEYSFKHTSA